MPQASSEEAGEQRGIALPRERCDHGIVAAARRFESPGQRRNGRFQPSALVMARKGGLRGIDQRLF